MTHRDLLLEELLDLMECSTRPSVLVECPHNFEDGPARYGKRERIIAGNEMWYDVFEYAPSEVVNKTFSEIRGFQGPLTSEAAKMQLTSLMITEESSKEGIVTINYTGRSRRALRHKLFVQIVKFHGRNVFFLCTMVAYEYLHEPTCFVERRREEAGLVQQAELYGKDADGNACASATPAKNSEDGAWEESLKDMLGLSQMPCILVAWDQDVSEAALAPVMRERIVEANPRWYDLYEYKASDVVGKAASEVRGFQGPLTSDASKLLLASLFVAEQRCVEPINVINYTERGLPLEITLRVNIYKRRGRNAAFFCTTTESKPARTSPSPIAPPAAIVGQPHDSSEDGFSDDGDAVAATGCFWSRESTGATVSDLTMRDEVEDPLLGGKGVRQRKCWKKEVS